MAGSIVIEQATMDFLAKLKKNNNRDWFNTHKDLYENARMNIEDFTMYLIVNVSKFDDTLAGLEPGDCLFRIYRDTRFSKDKTPYKTNFGILLGNKKTAAARGINYLHIATGGESSVYAGAHEPDSQFLFRLRKKIEGNLSGFQKILSAPDFKKYFGELLDYKLKNVPRGFDKESPAAEYLKYKEYLVGSGFSDKQVVSKNFGEQVVERFRAARRFNEFLSI